MQITIIRIDTTPEELANSPDLREIIHKGRDGNMNVQITAPHAPESGAISDAQELIPGVRPEGQDIVRERLALNAHGDLLRKFLAENMKFTGATVLGKNHLGQTMDYSDYLRLRRVPSRVGGYAYAFPATGVCEFRLTYESDEELHEVAPHARRLTRNHRANVHRVQIKIVDEDTLHESLQLAKMAYEHTL